MNEDKNYTYKITTAGWLVIGLIVILVFISGYFLVNYSREQSGGLAETKSEWQAIFLSSGETFFGRVKSENNDSVILQDIYYLQDIQSLHQGSDGTVKDFSLVKLGNEIHGPFDEMRINRSHILYVEDLKKDSKVVQAIERYKESK